MFWSLNLLTDDIVAKILNGILTTEIYNKNIDPTDDNFKYKLVLVCIMHYKVDNKKVPAALIPLIELCSKNAQRGIKFTFVDILEKN